MKIILSTEEITALIKRSFPSEMIPHDHMISEVEMRGYPIREYCITIEPKEVPKNE